MTLMAVGAVAIVAVAGMVWLTWKSDRCGSLESIASDEAKVIYLKAWLADRMAGENELPAIGRLGGDSKALAFRLVGLDLAYLGLDPTSAGITLHAVDWGRPLLPDNIEAVSFSEGRNAIIILTDNYDAASSRDAAIKSETARTIGDSVLVRCGVDGPD